MVVSINNASPAPVRTHIRLIEAEDASRVFRHMAPLRDVAYVEVCTTDMSVDSAWILLRDNGYGRLESDREAVYIVTACGDEHGSKTARYVATTLFGIEEPRVTHVHPASSQAGLAAATRR